MISLAVFGAVFAAMVFVVSEELKNASEENTARTQNEVIAVSARSVIWEAEAKLRELGADVQKHSQFRELFTKIIENPTDPTLKSRIAVQLDEQFEQRWVTGDILDLQKIRIYDLNFELVAESNIESNIKSLAKVLISRAKVRKGTDRLRQISDVWNDKDIPLLSMLTPVGGLKPKGYIEMVTGLSHELEKIELTTGQLTRIKNLAGDVLYQTSSLDSIKDELLVVAYEITDITGKTVVSVNQLISKQYLQGQFDSALQVSMAIIVGMVVTGMSLMVILFRIFLLKPVKEVQHRMSELAKGNIEVDTAPVFFISELQSIDSSLNDVVSFFRDRLLLIGDTGKALSVSAKCVSENAQSAVEGLRLQQAEVSEVGMETKNLMGMATIVTDQAINTSVSTKQTNDKAIEGENLVVLANESTTRLVADVNESARQISNLQTEAKSASAILDEIQNIADQTNLLALNAAIEAARAGEQGRGFAVVADEVRTLASRTFEATESVRSVLGGLSEGIIKAGSVMQSSQAQAEDTISNVTQLGEALRQIAEMVVEINVMNSKIETSAEEQTKVISNINQSFTRITEMAGTVSGSALKVTSSSGDLAQMAVQLESLVAAFKVNGLQHSDDQEDVELF